MLADNDNLSAAERSLFNDPAIEAAYQMWKSESTLARGLAATRKQFLMRIRALVQSGVIDAVRKEGK